MSMYRFPPEQFSPENEAIMEALISVDKAKLMEALTMYQEHMDVHKVCKNGTTIACVAVKLGNLQILKTILERQSACGKQISPKRLRTIDPSKKLPMRDLSNVGCHYSNLNVGVSHDKKYTYELDPCGNISQIDKYGKNALHYAVACDKLDMVEYLLATFKDLHCNQVDRTLKTPLHIAALRDNNEMINLLLRLGATVDSRDQEGQTPLHYACMRGITKMVSTLLEAKSDINALDYEGQSTLMLATSCNHYEVVELLLRNKVRVNYEDDRGFTALKKAVFVKNAKITKALVENGARICESLNLLHHAAKYDQIDIVKSLLDGGARLETRDSKGNTALMCAVEYRNFEIVKFLLEKGANPNSTQGISGITPLHISMYQIMDADLVKEYIDIFLKYGADIYKRCNWGFDALYYSFLHKNDPAACYLIRTGMNVNFRHETDRFDYMSSSMKHSRTPAPIKLLLYSGFDIKNFKDRPKNSIPVDKMNAKQKCFHEFMCTTLSLKDMCRIRIRRLVNPLDIPQLPLPSTLHKFLRLEIL
ncbi:ankyrin-1-like [Coccinella septempunctata]|uniref:ankyrin-1-like n=1 Tax=Coccinella septempunctata TaxID=41139 RepID=UPI001D062B64|nr:ankyrin-1-like [Coccinella septempunctata]XP_044752111.1 ankyrin-1-like [Coccinella septempunctata]